MDTPKEVKWSMRRGDTLAFAVEIGGLDGQDLDSAYFSCKTDPDATDYIFQKNLADGIEKIEGGKYRVRVAPKDTKSAELGTYFIDFQFGVNDDIFTPLYGKLMIKPEITEEGGNE